MKKKLSAQLRYSESLIKVIQPFLPLYHIKAITLVICLLGLAMFLCYPLWKIGSVGLSIWLGMIMLACIIIIRIRLLHRSTGVLLTSERLIDIDRPTVFSQVVHECALTNIQEVRYYKRGLLGMMWNVGTVVVQPENDHGHIEIRSVQHPEKLKELILRTCKMHEKPPIVEDL